MKKKAIKKLALGRETLRTLGEFRLEEILGGNSLYCSTASQPKCSGCETCAPCHI